MWFELDYPDVCYDVLEPGAAAADIPNACYAGSFLEVTPPKTTTPLLVSEPLHFTYGTASFDVGPLVAGTPPPSPPPSPVAARRRAPRRPSRQVGDASTSWPPAPAETRGVS